MSIAPTREPAAPPTPVPAEVLIKEARARQRRQYTVAAAAALVVVGAACVGFGIDTGSPGGRLVRASDWRHPSAGTFSEIPAPLKDTHPPRLGVLGIDPGPLGNTGTIYTWSGYAYSTVRAPAGLTFQNYSIELSPNGKSLLAYSIRGESLAVLPSLGTRSSHPVTGLRGDIVGGSALWSDDSSHLCSLRAVSSNRPWLQHPAELQLTTVGRGSANVATVLGGGDHEGTQLIACAVSANVAVLALNFMGSFTSITYVNLATGAQWSAPWYRYTMNTVQLSGNGQYAATGGGSIGGGEVISTSSGRVVGRFQGQSLGLSWLGHLVFVLGDDLQVPEVYDWQTHKVVWRAPGFAGPCPCESAQFATAVRPGTDELAINISHGETEAQFRHHDEYLRATLWFVTRARAWIVSRDVAPE